MRARPASTYLHELTYFWLDFGVIAVITAINKSVMHQYLLYI